MTTTELNKSVVTRFNHELIAGKKIELEPELFSVDFINHSVRAGYPNGSDGVIKFLSENLWTGFSDIHVEIHEQVAEGDLVTTRKTIFGRHTGTFMGKPPSNKIIGIPIIDLVRLKDGKYFEHWGINDMLSVFSQMES